jgi:hypothetical protein
MNIEHRIGKCLTFGLIVFGLFAFGCFRQPTKSADHSKSHGDHQHNAPAGKLPSATLVLRTNPESPEAGRVVEIRGMLHDGDGTMLNDFEDVHEKLIHLIVVRDGLDEFAHLHPTVAPDGQLAINHTFAKGGTYHVFVDYKPVGKPQATAKGKLDIGGETPAAPELKPDVPGRLDAHGLFADVVMDSSDPGPLVRFSVLDSSGNPVADLQPYLGVMGHLVVIGESGDQYVHSHPLDSKPGSNVVEFEVQFPKNGIFKLWGQFQRNGQVFTVPAVVDYRSGIHQH